MSEPSQTGCEAALAPSFQMVGSDEALVCVDGICAVPMAVGADVGDTVSAPVGGGSTA